MLEFLTNWLINVPATSAPYALAALGLILSERSGVLNLTAEGLMLVGALAGPEPGALVLVAKPEHDPVPAFRALAQGLRLPGDRR